MAWWPGWNSVEWAGWWSNFYFAASIVALLLLGVTEVVSHRYGSRKEELVAIAERRTTDERNAKDAEREAEAIALRQTVAAAERSANMAHEAHKPWHLLPEQRRKLLESIAPFKGQPVSIIVMIGDAKGMAFAEEMVSIFNDAGWNARDGVHQVAYASNIPKGVQIVINKEQQIELCGGLNTQRIPKPALALIGGLADAQIMIREICVDSAVPPSTIRFVIGEKEPSGLP